MKPAVRLATVAGACLATTGLFLTPATAATPHRAGGQHRSYHGGSAPVFVQNDSSAGNSVIAYDRSATGTLTQAGVYPTGGVGGALSGSVVDHLASQGSLHYDAAAGLLIAVNAGSNTITTFAVRGDHLTRLQILPSGGDFPVSVTSHGPEIYVLNARDGGSIQGYLTFGSRLFEIGAWNRPLGLDASQTPEFTSTPGQVAFTPDGRQLLVTTKGNGSAIDVFQVSLFGPSTRPTVNAEPGAVPFAVVFDRSGDAVVSEAGTDAVQTFAIGRTGTLTPLDTADTGQAATCWIAETDGSVYASNAGSGNVSSYRLDGRGGLRALGNTGTDAGTVDAAASSDGRNLYVQTGLAGIVDEYAVHQDGSLSEIGSVVVPDGVGGEGIVAL